MYVAGQLSPEEFWRMIAEMDERLRAEVGQIALYGLVNWDGDRMIGEWGHSSGRLPSASLVFGEDPVEGEPAGVCVHSTRPDSLDPIVQLKLRLLGPPRDGEQMDRTIAALRAERTEPISIVVNGSATEFRFSRWFERWWAVTDIDGTSIVVDSRGVDVADVALGSVTDIEPFIAGRRLRIKQLRGEA